MEMGFRAKIESNTMYDADTLMSKQINELSQSVKSLESSMRSLVEMAPKLTQIVDAYDSVIFGKKFLIGLATVVGSLAAVGGGVLWILDYIRHG